MLQYRINGSAPIKGEIYASGNKNAALPCIAAVLLTEEEVILHNIPNIVDTNVMIQVLKHIGTEATQIDTNTWRLHSKNIRNSEIPYELARQIRGTILFAGALLARTGLVVLPPPGGDVIGRRRLDTHFIALQGLGADLQFGDAIVLSTRKLVGNELFLDEASVTATENAIMAAVTAAGKTCIENAASEPHVQDLCNMLNAMGAKISGIGSNILYIEGVKKLHGTEFSLGADYMEIGSFIGLAAATHGELTIKNVIPQHLKMTRIAFARMGIQWEIDKNTIYVPAQQDRKVVPDIGGMVPKIDDSPWPGFPPDLTSIALVVATQITGVILIHEKLFESRMFFVDKLIAMGARIVLCDPHRAVISGPSKLKGALLTSPDVRAGMAMVIAALCATGQSRIANIHQIERGYENFVERLQAIGAQIERFNEPE